MGRIARTLILTALAGSAVAGVFLSTGSATTNRARVSRVTINVVAKDFSFALSKRSVPVGTTVVFKVVNKGKIGHNFKIAGKTTKLLAAGQSTTLTVTFGKKGTFPYVCTITGHARLGMKGNFGVGIAAPAPPPTTTSAGPTGPVGNANTTVTVNMIDYSFQLSQTSVPSGKVTFVIKNSGNDVHNFDVNGVKSGAIISPGQSETWTVSLPAGNYLYTCDVPFHVDRGMSGQLTVTP